MAAWGVHLEAGVAWDDVVEVVLVVQPLDLGEVVHPCSQQEARQQEEGVAKVRVLTVVDCKQVVQGAGVVDCTPVELTVGLVVTVSDCKQVDRMVRRAVVAAPDCMKADLEAAAPGWRQVDPTVGPAAAAASDCMKADLGVVDPGCRQVDPTEGPAVAELLVSKDRRLE